MNGPERFAPLHDEARRLLAMLEGRFDVIRTGPRMEPGSYPQDELPAVVRITPRTSVAAPLQIAFTPFPGLVVRAGAWYEEAIPACGCDRCDETPESAIERLTWLADQVTRGRFDEAIRLPFVGAAAHVTTLGDPLDHVERRRHRITRREGRRRLAEGGRRQSWQAWRVRRARSEA